jgi:hypothetical protein
VISCPRLPSGCHYGSHCAPGLRIRRAKQQTDSQVLAYASTYIERFKAMSIDNPLFPLGRIAATPGALKALREAGQQAIDFVSRHAQGDWGEVSAEDAEENELSIKKGCRIMSVYMTSDFETIWVITEADRSATTLLLPSEY